MPLHITRTEPGVGELFASFDTSQHKPGLVAREERGSDPSVLPMHANTASLDRKDVKLENLCHRRASTLIRQSQLQVLMGYWSCNVSAGQTTIVVCGTRWLNW